MLPNVTNIFLSNEMFIKKIEMSTQRSILQTESKTDYRH